VQLASEANKEITTKEIRKELQDKQSECAKFSDWYRREYSSGQLDWDICSVCTKFPYSKSKNLHQIYNSLISSDRKKNMKLLREATDAMLPLPFDDPVLKPYIEKWLPKKFQKSRAPSTPPPKTSNKIETPSSKTPLKFFTPQSTLRRTSISSVSSRSGISSIKF
jgi:hypothetical protein